MRQCVITDVVCSNFRRSWDNYERNTGERHSMQPKVASAGSKRSIEFASDPLYDEGTGNFWTGIIAILHD